MFRVKVVAADPSAPMVVVDDPRFPENMILSQPHGTKGARNLRAYYEANGHRSFPMDIRAYLPDGGSTFRLFGAWDGRTDLRDGGWQAGLPAESRVGLEILRLFEGS